MRTYRDALDYDLALRGPRVVLMEVVVCLFGLGALAVFAATVGSHDTFLRLQVYLLLALALNWLTLLALVLRRTRSTVQWVATAAARLPLAQRAPLALLLLVPGLVALLEVSHALGRATRGPEGT